ncbi:MAG: Holliday junction DNA helicase RuvA [Sphingobacteriales bacterium]|jgi:Holliday junction DNA helicase RuvA
MIAYLQGKLAYVSPTDVIIDCNGVGYRVNISLFTYGSLPKQENIKLHIYYHVKEDGHTLYGFTTEEEKNLFSHLISVSGVGPSTGRMILSYANPNELRAAIVNEDVALIKSIKGIGPKSAQRLILELKDKLVKDGVSPDLSGLSNNTERNEALQALLMLGFPKLGAEKAIDGVIKSSDGPLTVEELVKMSLKKL